MTGSLRVVDKLIIGVDPGLQTGLAWLTSAGSDERFSSVDLPAMEACDRIARFLDDRCRQQAVIAVERFTVSGRAAKMTRQNDALEIIGVCRWLARRHGVSFLLQGAGDAQRVGSRELLTRLGWWAVGGDHLNKAAAQVALAYQRAYPREFAQRINPDTIDA